MSIQRFIHPRIFDSPSFGALSHGARLLFIGLFTLADDHGRGIGEPSWLGARIFAWDRPGPDLLRSWAREVQVQGMARFYRVDGHLYYDLPKWTFYQKPKWVKPSTVNEFMGILEDFSDVENRPTGTDLGQSGDNPGPEQSNMGQWVGLGRVGLGRVGVGEESPTPPLGQPQLVTVPKAPPHRKLKSKLVLPAERVSELETWFEKLYAHHPRHRGRIPAWKAFLGLEPTLTRDVVNQIGAYITKMVQSGEWNPDTPDGMKSIPWLATVLNQKRWED